MTPFGKPIVTMVIKGKRTTFAGKGTPHGKIVEERKGENVVAFDAIDLFAYLMTRRG